MKRLVLLFLAVLVLGVAAPASAMAAPPAGVTGMALDGRVELSWQPAAGATGYRIYRGTSPGSITTPLMVEPDGAAGPERPGELRRHRGRQRHDLLLRGARDHRRGRVHQLADRAGDATGGRVQRRESRHARELPARATPTGTSASAAGVRAFGTLQSIDHGGSVDLKISAPGASAVDIEIFRSGYYGGAGARLFATLPAVPVATQPGCVSTASLGLYDCANWSVTQTITTTTAWPSGVYLIRATRNDTNADTHVLLVVRDDARNAEVLYGVPTTTYQAYNNYGGKSLYNHNSSAAPTVSGSGRAVKVSFDRPYEQQHDGIAHDWYTRTDYATVAWLERSGYDVSYGAVSDLERQGPSVARAPHLRLRRARRVLLGGHADGARAGARQRHRPVLHRLQRGLLEGPVRAERRRRPPGPRDGRLQDRPERRRRPERDLHEHVARPRGPEPARERADRRHVRRPEGLRRTSRCG